jgi:IS5 family transposase
VLRAQATQPTMWELLLPEQCLRMPAELVAVDVLLEGEAFIAPYRPWFDPELGRPSIPIESYVRMMFLKCRYKLSYETLCREVSDSISWRRFCRIPLDDAVPHPTTLMKITTRCGPKAVEGLNEALLDKAAENKVIKLDKVRADTTVVEANVAYPTDSGLLAKAVNRMNRLVERVHAAGGAVRTKVRDRRRSVRRHAHSIGAWLRRRSGDAKDEVLRITGELATLTELTAVDAEKVVANARRKLASMGQGASGKLAALVDELEVTIERARQIAAQARARQGGEMPDGATRLVSLHDPEARPIRKGRIGKPVEFGYKAQVVDNVDGIVVDHQVMIGNPNDAPLLVPAIERIKQRMGHAPRAVVADRGYGEAAVDKQLADVGVKQVVIPRRGKPGAARQKIQHGRGFIKLVKWRTGSEGRISHLKHGFGWNRTHIDGLYGARIWCGFGIFAHNSVKVSALIADKHDTASNHVPPRTTRGDKAHDPPPTPASPTIAA